MLKSNKSPRGQEGENTFRIHYEHTVRFPTFPLNGSILSPPSQLFITYTNTLETAEEWLAEVLLLAQQTASGQLSVVGLDTEERPRFKTGDRPLLAVLQLSTLDRACVLQVNNLFVDAAGTTPAKDLMVGAPLLSRLLQSSDETRIAGMGIQADYAVLMTRLFPTPQARGGGAETAAALFSSSSSSSSSLVSPSSSSSCSQSKPYKPRPRAASTLVDLKRLGITHGIDEKGGLLRLAQICLGVEKWKSKRLQMSRWDLFPLSRYVSCVYYSLV